MASSELVIRYHNLETEFFGSYVRHTTYHSNAARGERRVKVVKTWHRGWELGRGCSGTVFLERSEEGELRAVKDIAKDMNTRIKIDYRRELMAMAVLAKHDALFVQLFGWYESDRYIHIAMEYISHGHLRNYLEVERSESEAKVVIRQLLEGLVVIHEEGFAHRDLKPENIFVVSESPIWVKIGDFGLAKLAGNGTALRTEGGTRSYVAPEVGIDPSGDTSEYTNAVDIWSAGCIAHELLTRFPPFRGLGELMSYCYRPEFPRKTMLSKNISQNGIEFVESTLAYPPERRIAAKEALDSEWLRPECGRAVERKTCESLAVPGPRTRTEAAYTLQPRKEGEVRQLQGHAVVEGGRENWTSIESESQRTLPPDMGREEMSYSRRYLSARTATPEPANTRTLQGARGRSRTPGRDFLLGVSGPRSGGNHVELLSGRPTTPDFARIHAVADAGPGSGPTPPILGQHKPTETPPGMISVVLNSLKWLWRSESEERWWDDLGADNSAEETRWKLKRESRKKKRTEKETREKKKRIEMETREEAESIEKTKKEKGKDKPTVKSVPAGSEESPSSFERSKTRGSASIHAVADVGPGSSEEWWNEAERRANVSTLRKAEKEEQKDEPAAEGATPEFPRFHRGGLFAKPPARHSMAAAMQQAMSAQARDAETETAGTTRPLRPVYSFTESWGSHPPTSPGEPPRPLEKAEVFEPSHFMAEFLRSPGKVVTKRVRLLREESRREAEAEALGYPVVFEEFEEFQLFGGRGFE